MKIPTEFKKDGVLQAGTYKANFKELRKSILVTGDGNSPSWDQKWRHELTLRAEVLVRQLFKVGIENVYLDGSFVENKDHPNDIDGYFDTNLSMYDSQDMEKFENMVKELNSLNQFKIWDWSPQSRQYCRGFAKKQLPMWVHYRIELFPHLQQGTGIKDKYGNELKFPAAFRQSRHNFRPKGIVKITL